LLDIIIFVPYNLFRLCLVHKISIYVYIYENRKNKWKKEEEKEFHANWAGGGFWPSERGRARAGRWPSRPTEERNGASRRRGCGPTRQREGGNGVRGRSAAVRTGRR
jgi:hypothetical protein